MIVDVDPAAWSTNPCVPRATPEASWVSRGIYHRLLLLPIADNGRTCLERHQLKRRGKYGELGSPDFLHWWSQRERSPILEPGVYFSGFKVHWHYLIDGLGTLRAVEGMPRTLYVDQELADGQLSFLLAFAQAAGLPSFTRVVRLPGAAYRFTDGVFYTRQPISSRVSRVRTVLGIEHPGSAPGGKRLFVLRNGAASRRLLNQERIAALLQQRFGFEVLDPSTLSLPQQVEAFRDAAIVVGPHGSGLANAVFATRLELLVELFHTDAQFFYHSLCYALQARHHMLQCEPVGEFRDRPDNADYIADEEKVLGALESLLQAAHGRTQQA